MAVRVSKNSNTNKLSYISVPSQIINSLSSSALQTLLLSPKKAKNAKFFSFGSYKNPRVWFISLFLFSLFGMLKLGFNVEPLIPFVPYPCATSQAQNLVSNGFPEPRMKTFVKAENEQSKLLISNESLISQVSVAPNIEKNVLYSKSEEGVASNSLPNDFDLKQEMGVSSDNERSDFDSKLELGSGAEEKESDFWKQPGGLGYRPCLDFSEEYKKATKDIMKDRRKYLLVVVAGGMNQQRNQIVDAVVIARILGAALVVPILQVNVIWGDESEFSDIFDLDHFKEALADDVRIVSSLPSTHIRTRPVEEKRTPLHASPEWIRSHYLKKLTREGVLLLRGLDSRLSKDLPSDLQKLRCKVAFHALRFAPRILEIGNKLAERMRSKGPYLALHLRMEKDVWVRTGCLPGLSHEYDEIIRNERKERPELLTGRSHMNYHERKLAGLCPLTAIEVARLLKALGAPKNARIYWAGGQPLGGKEALLPLTEDFPNFFNKEDLALSGELEPFADKASSMAAIDYIVCESSDVFMPSHGGNMAHAIQGHRAYAGHKKFITPNKRHMLQYFMNSSLPETEFNRIIKDLHRDSLGQPELRDKKSGRDVTKYPVPECMLKEW